VRADGEKVDRAEVQTLSLESVSGRALRAQLRAPPGTGRPGPVRAVLPPTLVAHRIVPIPPLRARERTSYLASLARGGGEDALWKAIPLGPPDSAAEALLVTARREEVLPFLRTLARAGIRPQALLPPFAPALLLARERCELNPTSWIVVDLCSPEEVRLTVWDGGWLRLLRTLPLGEKERMGEALGAEILRTTTFYKTQSRGRRIERVGCVGASAADVPALRTLSSLGVLLGGVETLGSVAAAPEGSTLGALAVAAASAADASAFDLLPAAWRFPRLRRGAFAAALAVALGAGLAAGDALATLARARRIRGEALADLGPLALAFAPVESDARAAAGEREESQRLARLIDAVEASRIDLQGLLADLLDARPEGAVLEAVVFDAKSPGSPPALTAYGLSRNEYGERGATPLDAYAAALRRSPDAAEVRTEILESTPSGGRSAFVERFAIRLEARRGGP
jgi:hypothetical protein